jgi:hypothetical protein
VTVPLGFSLMPLENRREVLVRLAIEAERAGHAAFYLPETWAYDTTVLLGEVAARTTRIGLGTGILSSRIFDDLSRYFIYRVVDLRVGMLVGFRIRHPRIAIAQKEHILESKNLRGAH